VECSADGRNFEVIAQVDSFGTSAKVNHYEQHDNSPLTGTSYYRLRQVDNDDAFECKGLSLNNCPI